MGGSAQVVYQIARHLGKKGHAVTVVAGDYRYREKGFPEDNFQLILLRSLISQKGAYFTPSLITWARKHVAEFDVIHMHEFRTFQNAVVHHFAIRYGIPYLLSAHGTLPIILERKWFKQAYDLLFGRALLASASRLVAVSPVEVEQYRQAGVEEQRVRVICNGLDLEEFSPLPPRGTFRRRWGISEEDRVVLFLGRLHRIKGIHYLIEACAWLRARKDNLLLVIAGPDEGEQGKLEVMVEKLGLQDGVRFVGPLYGEDKLAAYVDADVLASPAMYEIFGLVPFEALMCGTPVVVTDDCGTGQLIGEAQAGYRVPYGDVEALAEALLRALTNREEALQMVAAGQRYIRERLDWRMVVSDLTEVYEEVLANAGTGR